MNNQSRNQQGAPRYNVLQERLYASPTPGPIVKEPFKIDGQWYREMDNGPANVLVPIDDPTVSPVLPAQQNEAIRRAFMMAANPLAGAAYGLATLAGASPQGRDRAMMAGGSIDAVMQGAAPFGARTPRAVRPPPQQPPLSTLPREAVI